MRKLAKDSKLSWLVAVFSPHDLRFPRIFLALAPLPFVWVATFGCMQENASETIAFSKCRVVKARTILKIS